MTKITVSLELLSPGEPLKRLEEIMGVPGDSGSYTVGEPRRHGKEKATTSTAYRRFYPSTTKENFGEQMVGIASRDLPKFLEAGTQATVEVCLVIAVFFHTMHVSIQLDPKVLEPFVTGGVKIEVVCYPCSDS